MPLVPAPDPGATPLVLLTPEGLARWRDRADPAMREWVCAMGFEAALGEVVPLPAPDGSIRIALAGWGTPRRPRPRPFPARGGGREAAAGTLRTRSGRGRDRR